MIGDDVDVAMDGFPVERGSAQLDITDRSESSAGDGTMGRPSAVEKGPITGYKRLRAAERLEAVATECTLVRVQVLMRRGVRSRLRFD